jgi:hypothetical protein
MKPTTSICLREATSAPVVANATIPNQSNIAAKVSNRLRPDRTGCRGRRLLA